MIDELEGDTALKAIRALCPLWRRCWVVLWVDNSAFQLSARKGWSKADRLNTILREILFLAAEFEFVIDWRWISTTANIRADPLSRYDEQRFLEHGLYKFDGINASHFNLRRHPDAGNTRSIG